MFVLELRSQGLYHKTFDMINHKRKVWNYFIFKAVLNKRYAYKKENVDKAVC